MYFQIFLILSMFKNVLKTNLFVVNNNLYGFFLFCEEENPEIIIVYDDTLAETNKLTFVISLTLWQVPFRKSFDT